MRIRGTPTDGILIGTERRRRPCGLSDHAGKRGKGQLLWNCDAGCSGVGILEVVRQRPHVIRREIVSMASNLDVTVAVNMDSGTTNLTPFAKLTRNRGQALAAVARRTSPTLEMAA